LGGRERNPFRPSCWQATGKRRKKENYSPAGPGKKGGVGGNVLSCSTGNKTTEEGGGEKQHESLALQSSLYSQEKEGKGVGSSGQNEEGKRSHDLFLGWKLDPGRRKSSFPDYHTAVRQPTGGERKKGGGGKNATKLSAMSVEGKGRARKIRLDRNRLSERTN